MCTRPSHISKKFKRLNPRWISSETMAPATVILEMEVHCNGCAIQIDKTIKKFSGAYIYINTNRSPACARLWTSVIKIDVIIIKVSDVLISFMSMWMMHQGWRWRRRASGRRGRWWCTAPPTRRRSRRGSRPRLRGTSPSSASPPAPSSHLNKPRRRLPRLSRRRRRLLRRISTAATTGSTAAGTAFGTRRPTSAMRTPVAAPSSDDDDDV